MAATKIADLVCTIPFDQGNGQRYVTVGAMLKLENNDPSKGPGFIIMLDKTFNPAGLQDGRGSVVLSCYHPSENRKTPYKRDPDDKPPRQHPLAGFNPADDDIPF